MQSCFFRGLGSVVLLGLLSGVGQGLQESGHICVHLFESSPSSGLQVGSCHIRNLIHSSLNTVEWNWICLPIEAPFMPVLIGDCAPPIALQQIHCLH